MDKRNIIIPIKLPETVFTFVAGTYFIEYLKTNYSLWYESNKRKLEKANSIRLYAKTEDLGVLIDGNIATIDNSLVVEEAGHFIENVFLKNVSIIAPGEVVIQIGFIG